MADALGLREGTELKPKIKNMFIFNPKLGNKEGREHEKVIYYFPESESLDIKIKNAGLATAVVSFAQSFDPSGPCEALHTKKTKQVFVEIEPDYWMSLSVYVPHAAVDIDGEMVTEYFDDNVKDLPLQVLLRTMYNMFKLFNGTFEAIIERERLEGLKEQLGRFYSRYLKHFNLGSLDIFTVYQGVQFLPLDKLVFMKVHQFVNKLESTHPFLKRGVMLYGSQLMWSGLEREDMQVFYHYLTTMLFPKHLVMSDVEPTAKQSFSVKLPLLSSPTSTSDEQDKGMYLLGPKSSGGGMLTGSCPRVHILVDGELAECTLCVYHVLNITFCMFLQANVSMDVLKRLESNFGDLRQLSSLIVDYTSHSKAAQMDLQYRYIYFNAMNFAVKSPLLGKKSGYSHAIPNELMRILIQVDKDHRDLEATETILQTDQNLWLVYRKSGQRQFAVFFQKGYNFFDICEEVRKLSAKEFSSVFILD